MKQPSIEEISKAMQISICKQCGYLASDPFPIYEVREVCAWDQDHPTCPDCKEIITGSKWNLGRCLECHEAALLPATDQDEWEEYYSR